MNLEKEKKEPFYIKNEPEKKLLEHIRELTYGEIKIIVQDGKPIRIEEIRKSIKLQD